MLGEENNELVLLFACAGGSNVGQLANEVGKALTVEGKGKLFCLAGIGGQVEGIVRTAKEAKQVIAIDGCSVRCAGKTLEKAGVVVHSHTVLTEVGFEKNSNLSVSDEEIAKAKMYIE